MPLLYESYANPKVGDLVTVHFETKDFVQPSLLRQKLEEYNWTAKGLQLINLKVHEKGGNVTVKVLPTFILPITWVAIAAIVPAAIGLVATIIKMWTVSQVASPLLAPGPLGFPMVFWLIIAASGVLIPLAIILHRR